jgi:hypothetical protein
LIPSLDRAFLFDMDSGLDVNPAFSPESCRLGIACVGSGSTVGKIAGNRAGHIGSKGETMKRWWVAGLLLTAMALAGCRSTCGSSGGWGLLRRHRAVEVDALTCSGGMACCGCWAGGFLADAMPGCADCGSLASGSASYSPPLGGMPLPDLPSDARATGRPRPLTESPYAKPTPYAPEEIGPPKSRD